ncbi:response regulator [Marimonas sp. MJW-29]|uniref:Response regulator n=1 Tax=Sulfitobacter sediminis TaxID=3234186 RepID=A0ABV3RPP5_9RHOB
MKRTILVVEDDPKIRKLLRNVMEAEGFAVRESETGSDVLDILDESQVALITLDIQLGSDSGVELAKQIRQKSAVPLIMVTGKDDVIDRVVGLEVGADDYVTKPFHVRELVARVRSVLRRSEGQPAKGEQVTKPSILEETEKSPHFRFDGMTAIPDRLELRDRDGSFCDLTSGDFKLLSVFMERPKRVLSRDQLMDLIGGQSWSPLDRTVDNQVARLRKKIERDPSDPKLIKTVRGVGYTFACDVEVLQPPSSSAKSA